MDRVKHRHDLGLRVDPGVVGPESMADDGPMSREMGRREAGVGNGEWTGRRGREGGLNGPCP